MCKTVLNCPGDVSRSVRVRLCWWTRQQLERTCSCGVRSWSWWSAASRQREGTPTGCAAWTSSAGPGGASSAEPSWWWSWCFMSLHRLSRGPCTNGGPAGPPMRCPEWDQCSLWGSSDICVFGVFPCGGAPEARLVTMLGYSPFHLLTRQHLAPWWPAGITH